jgi:hypothetical protein
MLLEGKGRLPEYVRRRGGRHEPSPIELEEPVIVTVTVENPPDLRTLAHGPQYRGVLGETVGYLPVIEQGVVVKEHQRLLVTVPREVVSQPCELSTRDPPPSGTPIVLVRVHADEVFAGVIEGVVEGESETREQGLAGFALQDAIVIAGDGKPRDLEARHEPLEDPQRIRIVERKISSHRHEVGTRLHGVDKSDGDTEVRRGIDAAEDRPVGHDVGIGHVDESESLPILRGRYGPAKERMEGKR